MRMRGYGVALMILAGLASVGLAAGKSADRGKDSKSDELWTKPAAINVTFAEDPGPGNYDGVVGQPRHTWNFVPVGTRKMKRLRSAKGKTTPVTLKLSENDGAWGIAGVVGIFHGYLYHNNRSVDLKARLTHLAPGRYRILVYAHGDRPEQNASIQLVVGREKYPQKATLNDGTWDFRADKLTEGVQYVSFEFDVVDEEPVEITAFRDGSSYSMLNAIQIVPIKSH